MKVAEPISTCSHKLAYAFYLFLATEILYTNRETPNPPTPTVYTWCTVPLWVWYEKCQAPGTRGWHETIRYARDDDNTINFVRIVAALFLPVKLLKTMQVWQVDVYTISPNSAGFSSFPRCAEYTRTRGILERTCTRRYENTVKLLTCTSWAYQRGRCYSLTFLVSRLWYPKLKKINFNL